MFDCLFKCTKRLLHYAFVALLLFFCNCASATTIEEAMAAAYLSNPNIKSALQSLMAVDEEMPSAFSGMLPSASASLQRGRKNSNYESSGISSDGVTDTKSIEITQPLFRGGKTYASIKKAKSDVMANREAFKQVEQQVLLDAATAYMDVVSNNEFYELAKNNEKLFESHFKSTTERFRLGELTKTDVAQSQAGLAKAKSDLVGAKFTLESSKATFERVIGLKPSDIAMPKNPIDVKVPVEQLVTTALNNSPQLKIAQYDFDASKHNINIKKSTLMPQLDAYAIKQRQYSGVSGTSSGKIDSDSFGVTLSIPIYQSGLEYSAVRQAKHIAGEKSFNLEVVRDKVKEDVIKAAQDLSVAKSKITSDEENVAASTIALDGVSHEEKAGLRTVIELLDEQQAVFNAKAGLIKSRRDAIVSSYKLLAQLGKLTAKELGLKVDEYDTEKNYNNVKHQIIGF